MKTVRYDQIPEDFFQYKEPEELSVVKDILNEVRTEGDAAVKKYTEKFDHAKTGHFMVSESEIQESYENVDSDLIEVLKQAAKNIQKFSIRQMELYKGFRYELEDGVITGQKVIPVNRVCVYVPGGRFPLISSVLMGAIPAKIAGVTEITICSPPTTNGKIHPAILATADICGVNEVYQIGGAQAVAAMAYGTETIKPVDKIVGPGNKFVTAAKREVFGKVGIDFLAGPSEVLIIADDSAEPNFIAADFLAQSEHDPDAQAILITDSEEIAQKVEKEIQLQLKHLSTKDTATQSVENNGMIILTDNMDQAVEIANKKAPEHLEIHVKNTDFISYGLNNYGTLFIGSNSAEIFGDYSCGINHTLPTNFAARYTGGLSVKDFLKFQTTLKVSKKGVQKVGPIAMKIAQKEGLNAHYNAAAIRMSE